MALDEPSLAALRKDIARQRDVIFSTITLDSRLATIRKALFQWSQIIDHTITRIWQTYKFSKDAVLIATGGYGRKEQFPYSDIDLLLLFNKNPKNTATLEHFWQTLWSLDLHIGHTTCTVAQSLTLAKKHIATETSFIKHRYLLGNKKTYHLFDQNIQKQLEPIPFYQAKMEELKQRHMRFDNTPYQLEPNCKLSPGGLRDIQTVLWIAQVAGFGDRWYTLAQRGLMSTSEERHIRKQEKLLYIIRISLHLISKRSQDFLSFDLQPELAAYLGVTAQGSRSAAEVLMQKYYRLTKAVTQISAIVLQNTKNALMPTKVRTVSINDFFQEVGDQIDIRADTIFTEHPHTILDIFSQIQKRPHIKGITLKAQRALWHSRFVINQAFRKNPAYQKSFLAILKAPLRVTHILRHMHDMTILGRYLPAFRRIIGQTQETFLHSYTVDYHSLIVVRNLRRFLMPLSADEFPLCTKIMTKWKHPWRLYVAALFHDIAKGQKGDHSLLGARLVQQFCQQHRISASHSKMIVFLVKHHLTLSHYAQKLDFSSPRVIARLTALIRQHLDNDSDSENALDYLYVFTVADMRATGPKVWNEWRAQVLTMTYLSALANLRGEAHKSIVDRKQERILSQTAKASKKRVTKWLNTMDINYFVRHPLRTILWHSQILAHKPRASVKIRLLNKGWQVVVYTPNDTHLFARICHAFDSVECEILGAQIATTAENFALDTFFVQPLWQSDTLNLAHYEEKILALISAKGALKEPVLGSTSRIGRLFPTESSINFEQSRLSQRLRINIVTNNRHGLLYLIAYTFAQFSLDIQTARIVTLGTRVNDTFLVDYDENFDAASQDALNQLLLAHLINA